jgi:hypothetical protein
VKQIIRKLFHNSKWLSLGTAKKYKIVIVGNCQARPLAHILKTLNPAIDVYAVAVVHLLKQVQIEEYIPAFENADIIISQLISENYPCEFVRTNFLRESFNEKLITILNLYYSGYNPELIYIRNSFQGTLKGPLWDYHNKTIVDSWREGISTEHAARRIFDKDYNKEKYLQTISTSMNELKRRELLTNIKATDLIEQSLSTEKLFFTFNHPSMNLMTRMCRRILREIGLECIDIEKLIFKEALDKIAMPVNVFSKAQLKVNFQDLSYFQGVACEIEKDGRVQLKRKYQYSLNEIIEKYYKIYDQGLS